jgi:hypothetical protein
MSDSLSHPLLLAALWFAVILALLALAIVGLRRWRGGAADDRPMTSGADKISRTACEVGERRRMPNN